MTAERIILTAAFSSRERITKLRANLIVSSSLERIAAFKATVTK